MQKLSILFFILVFMLVGCGTETSNEDASEQGDPTNAETGQDNNDADPAVEEETEEGYVFEIDGVSIAMHAEAEPILDQLGGSKDYFESEACAFPGLEKVYTFDGYDLYTYEQDGVDYIASVVLTDDTVSTTEGLSLFADGSDVFETYGDDYTQSLVSYTYLIDRSQLIFLIEDDEVTSIEYLGTVD